MRLSLYANIQSHIVTSAAPGFGAVRTFYTIIKGAPPARRGLTALAANSADGREQSRGMSCQGDPP